MAKSIRSVRHFRARATKYFSIRRTGRNSSNVRYRAATQAQQLLGAPRYAAGSYPLIMDYAMAKGLAHEAFGHAAETDGMRTSILGTNGVFRSGERMAAPIVSIIDEPLERDHAYQPFSPNGVPRGRATILDHGVLTDALADVFSARAGRRTHHRRRTRPELRQRAGAAHDQHSDRVTRSGADRPASYEDQGPEDVRAALAQRRIYHRRTSSDLSGGL